MPALRVHPGRALLLAFAAVATSFVLATIIGEHADLQIEETARRIAGNASLSAIRLSTMRSELRRLELSVDDLVGHALAGGNPRTRETRALVAAQGRMHSDWSDYIKLPEPYPREHAQWPFVAADLQSLDQAVERALAAVGSKDRATALRVLDDEIKPLAERLDERLLRIVDLKASEGARLAHRIDDLGRHAIRMATILDALSLFLTVIAGWVAVRTVNRYTRLLRARAEELEMFSGRVAHDILGPLNTVGISLALVERLGGPGATDKTREVIGRGQAGVQRVKRIVEDLLDFARAGARPQPGARADVRAVVDDVLGELEPVATQAGAALCVEVDGHPTVACSAGALTSLVSNLVRNALKFLGEAAVKRVTVRVGEREKVVRFEVEDTGPGLPAGVGRSVFEPYVRADGAKQPGIGLGLATVRRIAEGHGGRVGVQSRPGAGALFWFELPAAAGAAATAEGASTPVAPPPRPTRPSDRLGPAPPGGALS